MRLARAALLCLLGCQSTDDDRQELQRQAVSIRSLDGWTERQEHGATVLAKDGVPSTIAIKAADPPRPDHDETPAATVLRASETLVRTLPEAAVTGPTTLDHPRFQATSFHVTFKPPGKTRRYERRHVVLIGERVVHVMHTGPAGTLDDSAELFDQVIATLREEI